MWNREICHKQSDGDREKDAAQNQLAPTKSGKSAADSRSQPGAKKPLSLEIGRSAGLLPAETGLGNRREAKPCRSSGRCGPWGDF